LSIQNRLLLTYTAIFTVAYLLFALVVYVLPSRQILARIDEDLSTLATELVSSGTQLAADNTILVPLPENLATLQTASTFLIILDRDDNIAFQSRNLAGYDQVLDPAALHQSGESFSLVPHQETLLRVHTRPVVDAMGRPIGHIQVARLLDNYEVFQDMLIRALLVGTVAALGALVMAAIVTNNIFQPLDDIATVARQITRADDLSRRVPHSTRSDEIGDLARAFNQTLERLERLFRSQQRFLADVSHELRTPLTSMRGNMDLMQRMELYDEESVEVIQEEMERMSRLLGDLLLLARADSGGLPLRHDRVELDNLLFDIYRQMGRMEKPVELELAEVDQIVISGDEDRLKQLLLNLVDNAIKYTPDGGQVSLSLTQDKGWARLTVTDTGIGIPPEDLPHIFDRFYRVDKARNRAMGGSGLGLAIAKWVVQAHGGTIQVQSVVGQGTTFTVTLPVMPSTVVVANGEPEELDTKTRPGLRSLGPTLRRHP
jgi:heavy metal sensor kinase